MMRNKFLILLFGLLLAVGWTNDASAQQLPAESLSKQLVSAAVKPQAVMQESLDFLGVCTHSHSDNLSQLPAHKVTGLKANRQINEIKGLNVEEKNVGHAGSKAPLRADGDLDMKSLTKAEADALEYEWDNGDGTGVRTSKSTEVATDPYQMYELLRYVYMTPAFPGPTYSAYTKNNQRERLVYYGGIDGGWNIPGVSASSAPVAGTTTVANGTTTNSNIPVSGNYQDWGYRSQMIYLADLLDMSNGDQITSITFYPSSGLKFAGSTVVFQLCNTSESNFGTSSSSSTSRKTVSGAVTATISPSVNNSATEWTITFDSPLTYTGGNLLLDVYCQGYTHDGITGSYSSTPCYGANQTNYQSMYVTGSSSATPSASATGSNSRFLPKATFGYTTGGGTVVKRLGDIVFNDNGTTSNTTAGLISSIVVTSGSTVIASWDYPTNGFTLPFVFVDENNLPNAYSIDNVGYLCFEGNGIYLPSSWLTLYNDVKIEIKGWRYSTSYNPIIYVNGDGKSLTSTDASNPTTLIWNIEGTEVVNTAIPEYENDTYKPDHEGYTVLLVAVKDDATQSDDANFEAAYENGFHDTPEKIINYLTNNVDSIMLLTDGVRIGEGMDAGTVFNCTATLNKFFFLGKGQARQKTDAVRRMEILEQHLIGEYVPFRFMYEEFSPTSGEAGSQTTDFYSRMMDGHVYNVVHDCRSVIGLGHQFSMSGNDGTTPYALTSLNFFVPDYRLKYWIDNDYYVMYYHIDEETGEIVYDPDGPYTVDGRIMNPYQTVSTDGDPTFDPSLMFTSPGALAVWYAQYNQEHAPQVGLYKITLDADATSNGAYGPDNTFTITLDWTSSLDEMANGTVDQTYYLYMVTVDEYGNETIADEPFAVVDNATTYSYPVGQEQTSQTFYYIVKGTPVDDEHSKFFAWSNDDYVVIPGYDDFLALEREHYESDFVIGNVDRGEKNYYRNFLLLSNINDDNALTVAGIGTSQDYILQRYNYDDPNQVKTDVATINLSPVNGGKYVDARITYNTANQDIYEPEDNPNKYHLSTMHMQETANDEGILSVTGNGDIVIQPSGYEVNFKSISVTVDGTTTTWSASTDGDNLPTGWHLSPSNWWTEYEGGYYLDGGGYIYIPTNDATAAQVAITAYGDGTSIATVTVNGGTPKAFANGSSNAETKYWTVNTTLGGASKAGNRETVTETVTVNPNGTVISEYVPLLGYYYDYRQQWSQIIYTADQLNLSPGDVIKAITFYPTTSTLILSGGEIHVYMASCTESNYDAGFAPVTVDYDNSLVASFTPNANTDCSNGWTITFDTPFTYNGGNIVIDIDTNIGDTYTDQGEGFYGVETSSYMGFFVYYETSGTNTGWTGARFYFQPKATFVYDTEGGEEPPTPTVSGMVRMRLPIVDEFSASTADNDHPRRYVYQLAYAPNTADEKTTNTVEVPVLHTGAEVKGFYTLDEIKEDTDRELEMNVLNAEVDVELANLSSPYYYTINRKTNARPNVQTGNRAVLQHREDNWYQEMRSTSPRYRQEYEPGSTYKCLDTEGIVTGDYNNFMSYVPVVWTKGFDRRYYDEDEINNPEFAHNSYGASVYKTGVGQVVIGQGSIGAEKQTGQTGHWTEGNDNVNLYILTVNQVKGYLPTTSTVEYEPYMFRVFVESPNGKLRGYKYFEEDQATETPSHFEPDPEFTADDQYGPWCVWTEYVNINDWHGETEIDFTKAKDATNWDNCIRFAGLSDIVEDEDTPIDDGDLMVYVRFYYILKGSNVQPSGLRDGEGGEPAGYGAEGSAKPDPYTALHEIYNNGVVESVTYVNPQGMQSSRPFDGVNIVITRYSDGTTRTTKIIR